MTRQRVFKAIKPLTLEVAISYLQRHAWTTHEAVLMLNLIDPRCYVFYEGNGKKKHGNVSTYFEGMVLFNPDRKNLKVSDKEDEEVAVTVATAESAEGTKE